MSSLDDLLGRVDERLEQIGKTDRRASLEATGKADTIRNLRRGRQPSAVTLRKLAVALECTVSYLIDGTPKPGQNAAAFDEACLWDVVAGIAEYYQEKKIALDPNDLAELTVHFYNSMREAPVNERQTMIKGALTARVSSNTSE